MLKLIGVCCLLGGGASLGICWSTRLHTKVVILREVISALRQMERELAFSLTSMPDLMEKLCENTHQPVQELFLWCAQGLERLGEVSFGRIWSQGVCNCLGTILDTQAQKTLCVLGAVLGRYDRQEQCRALEVAVADLEGCLHQAEGEWHRLGRVYTTLGVGAGGMLVLLLI